MTNIFLLKQLRGPESFFLLFFYFLFQASDSEHVSGRTSPKTSPSEAATGRKKQAHRRHCYPVRKIPSNSGGSSPDIMEELRDQVKSLTKIVAELTEMKAREKVTSLPLLSDSDLTFINEHDDVVKETPPQAPPAAITSAIIVPEPQVPQPLSAPSSLPTYPPL